jgi:TolB-like protein/Tfp pilus assembly protein PilF
MVPFLRELHRRNVVKVATVYAAVAWLLAQIADTILPAFDVPGGVLKTLLVIIGLGFPVTVVLAWVYELTPAGFQRTDEVSEVDRVANLGGRRLDFTIIGCMSVAILFLVLDNYIWESTHDEISASIAVLPFAAQFTGPGDESDTAYLSEGIADSLIMRLSRISSLKVKSRAAISSSEEDVQTLGRLLGVDAICMGKLVQRGQELEITVELISTNDGTVMWSDRFLRRTSSLLAIESDISAEIVKQLKLVLSIEEKEILARDPTSNPAAHRLYLQGRYYWNRRQEAGLRVSADIYRRAIDLDPNYALAWAGLADSNLMLLAWGMEQPVDAAPRVIAAAQRSIELDPMLAEPHATLGYLKTLYEWDWEGARKEFLRAIELNNNYSSAHHWYAFYLLTIGDSPAAVEEILLARDFEPLSPIINAEVGYFYLLDRQYDQALAELQQATLLDPSYTSILSYLVRAQAFLGQHEQAMATLHKWRSIDTGGLVGTGYGNMVLPMLGLQADAHAAYQAALQASKTQYLMPGVLAVMAAVIGERDAAFEHFDKALAERSLVLSWLRDPLLDGIRDDPRYARIYERVGLKP